MNNGWVMNVIWINHGCRSMMNGLWQCYGCVMGVLWMCDGGVMDV